MSLSRTVVLGEREIARIGLGTNRLTDTDRNVEFIREAADAGIGMIDTAHLYTSGESERTLGRALSGLSARPLIATKGGFGAGEGRPDKLREQIGQSLDSLRTDRIDLYYVHRVHPDTPLEETLGVIRDFVDDGRIAHVGLSQVSIEQIERGRAVVPIAAVQNRYNLGERGSDDVVDYCARERIAFVPFFPLHGDAPSASADIAARHDITEQQVVLAWLLHRSPAIAPIPGTLSIDHVRENVAALDVKLSGVEFAALAHVVG